MVKKKIIIADDEQFIVAAYKDGLQRSGFLVTTAQNGEEALKAIYKTVPDLVLLDLIMPRKNGFDILKELRADPKFASTPIIVLSNLSQQSDVTEAKNLGATDFVVKADLSLAELIMRIKLLLGDK
jgi:two-component system, OmpR family, response regulator VicR